MWLSRWRFRRDRIRAAEDAPNEVFSGYDVVDLSVLVSETLPAQWALNPPLQRWTNNWFVPGKNAYGTVSAPK